MIMDLFRPVLSDRTIKRYTNKSLLIASPIKDKQIQPNSVDITLGNTWKKICPDIYGGPFASIDTIDTRKEINYVNGVFEKLEDDKLLNDGTTLKKGTEYYMLRPKEFVLMASDEVLNIPNGILSFVQGRSSIARLGIQTEQAGLIDAGFQGTITFEIFNQTKYNIMLYRGMRVAQLYFFKSQYAKHPYGYARGSKYQTQIVATGSKIHMDFKD